MNKFNKLTFHITSGGALTGMLQVPGDKSMSHRAIMLGAIAEGVTEISGFLEGEDCLATLSAFKQMGVNITKYGVGEVRIEGVGLHGLKIPDCPLDLGNSGTSMRLLTGLLAGQKFPTTLIGDVSLSKRPMRRVTEPLKLMGANIYTTEQGTAPLQIYPVKNLNSIHYQLPVASAQIKSCLLLAGLYADGTTCVQEPAPSRDHTERMLSSFGYEVTPNETGVCVTGGGRLLGRSIVVPSDISSAAFFLVGASIAPESDLILTQVGMNPTRIGVIEILKRMGANIEILAPREIGGEPVADLRVRSAKLRGIHIPEALVPLAIDEFPAIFIAAACAEGETVLSGAAELRVKESDRIQVMADGLIHLGILAQPLPDGIRIHGGQLNGGTINSHGDHRIAMAFAMAGLRAGGNIVIEDCANVNTSFPGFVELAANVGLKICANSGI